MTPTPTKGFIERVIAASGRNPWMTILLALALSAWGWYGMTRGPLDAIPDLSDVQVIIFTEWMGQSPGLVEDQVTYPITTALLSAPKVQYVRGQSMFGMSFVNVIFEDGTDIYWARSRVLEYLNEVQDALPEGVRPTLGPDATGVGWVFQYALVDESGQRDLSQLRSLQDWHLRYALESVPGVAEVATVGGFVKAYQVQIDPNRLLSYGIPFNEVVDAIRQSNEDVGGRVMEIAGHEYVVRGRGYATKIEDLESIALRAPNGTPVLLGDVARVSLGPDQRRGLAELDGKGEAVGGIVVMRFGENALDVIGAVKTRLAEIEKTLPKGVKVVVTYDRSELIEASVATLRKALIEEMLVVSLVIFFFLMHVRSALVPVITLPIAALLAFIPMFYQGLTINIMSLGGIIVAVGAMVDASMILIENVHKRLEGAENVPRRDAIISAMQEVGPSIFYSLLVITVAFLPVFTLEGAEGRLFKPLAFTKSYSMAFAALLAVTLTPALAVLVIRGRIQPEERNPLNRWLIRAYTPVVRFVVDHRWGVIVTAILIMVVSFPAYQRLGREFMPPLNEGVLLYMPSAPPGMSVPEASRLLQAMDREIMEVPEVARVFGKMGRAETATDPAPIGMAETIVLLKPRDQWRAGMTWDLLVEELDQKLRYPGMPNLWWMPIQTRTEMLATGIRSPLGIKVFGDDLHTIEQAAVEIEKAMTRIPGTRSVFADRSTGGLYLDVEIDRRAAARYGLRVMDVNAVVASAVGGMTVSTTIEGRERYPITVRYARELRDEPSDLLGRVLVSAPGGAQIPLSQVARITPSVGPPMVRSEDGRLVGFVFVDVGDRPLADYVDEARQVVSRDVRLPEGVRLEWAGQFTYFERAKERLKVMVPVTLLIIVFLLYVNTKSVVETGIVLLAVPFSLVGAIWLLYLLGYNMSVAVWVGLIALAGVDAETGVVMLLYLTISHRKWKEQGRLRAFGDLREAIVEGAAQRIRPKLMTVLTDMIGLLPVLLATGTGSDLMKRIAAPLVGGITTSFVLELTVYPAIFAIWKGRRLAREEGVEMHAADQPV